MPRFRDRWAKHVADLHGSEHLPGKSNVERGEVACDRVYQEGWGDDAYNKCWEILSTEGMSVFFGHFDDSLLRDSSADPMHMDNRDLNQKCQDDHSGFEAWSRWSGAWTKGQQEHRYDYSDQVRVFTLIIFPAGRFFSP